MSDLADLFEGFASQWVSTEAGRIFARVGGSGPPLALLHGFPETMAMWHALAPTLARSCTVVAMDLRGYGWSSAPRSSGGDAYSKRRMGEDVVAVMERLGHARFALAGHDRGARVGYRLALDHPGRLSALALLDILPTLEVWRRMARDSVQSPHWRTLAAPEPGPEQAIAADLDGTFEGWLTKWAGGPLAGFDPRALAHYRAAWGDPSRIHAMCEDYRAGATLDREADEADLAAGRTIACPTLVLASTGYLGGGETALDCWRRLFAPGAVGAVVESGHFLAEQAPVAVLDALLPFLAAHATS